MAIVDDLLLLFVKSHLYRFIFLFFFRLLFAEQIFALQVVNLLKSLTSGGFLRYHSYFFSQSKLRGLISCSFSLTFGVLLVVGSF